MHFHYDKKVDALYIRFSDRLYGESNQIQDDIILDYDKKGEVIGIEVLRASKKFPHSFASLFLKHKLPLVLDIPAAVK